MYWTKEMAEAITRGELSQYSEQCTEELMKVRAGEGEREVKLGEGSGAAKGSYEDGSGAAGISSTSFSPGTLHTP